MPERVVHISEAIQSGLPALSTTLIFAVGLAFGKGAKDVIKKRANYASEQSGRGHHTGHRLECAHISHARDRQYNNPNNGRLLTVGEHYLNHCMNEGNNGLPYNQNQYARRSLWERMTPREQAEAMAIGFGE